MRYFFLTLFVLLPFLLEAKRFSNEYTEFELPPGWECALEGSEWVCQSTNDARKKEAIIILVAKIRGPQDTIEEYLGYLKKTKSYKLPGGKSQVSEPKYAKLTDIQGQQWVDALHLASEVPGFYTRYLASTKEDLGMAITFSVAKEQYDTYKGVFDNIVNTLRMFRQKKVAVQTAKARDESLFNNQTGITDEGNVGAVSSEAKPKAQKESGGDMMLLLLLVGAAVVGFIIMKRRKK